MNKFLRPLVGLGLLTMPVMGLAASVDYCDEPTPVEQYRDHKLYGFSSKVTCYLTTEDDTSVKGIADAYQTHLKTSPAFKLQGAFSPAAEGGLSGVAVQGRETMATDGHGTLEMVVDFKLLSNQHDMFVYSSKTQKITGSGNAAYTKSRQVKVKAHKGERFTVETSLDVLVQKPGLAFIESLFTEPAARGVFEQISEVGRAHAERVAKALSAAEG